MALPSLLLVVALLALGSSTATAARTQENGACRSSLPAGPRVPAPVLVRTSCGGFLLARDGSVTRLQRRWFDARAGGTGRRYGADLRLRRTRDGRFVLARNGRVVWRTHGRYRNEGGNVAFGPGVFAFSAHRRGVFITDLRGQERLIVRGVGLHPLAFLGDGTLLVVRGGRGSSISRVTQKGRLLAFYRYRRKNGYEFDHSTEALHLVTPERVLVRATVAGARVVRPLGDLDGWLGRVGPFLTLSDFAHRGSSAEIRLAVLEHGGDLVSRWAWRSPTGVDVDYGPVPSPDGRSFAFRTVTRPRGDVVVYLLLAGATRPTAVLRHRGGQLGCGIGAGFSWKGRFALYVASDGPAAILDTRGGRIVFLRALQSALSSSPHERPSVFWASDVRPNDWRRD